jgi:hypothetical protein
MLIRFEVGAGTLEPIVRLLDPDDCTRFSAGLTPGTTLDDVDQALAGAGAGRRTDENLWISVAWLQDAAGDQDADVSADWPDRFDAMLAYADSKGWLDHASDALRAHIA